MTGERSGAMSRVALLVLVSAGLLLTSACQHATTPQVSAPPSSPAPASGYAAVPASASSPETSYVFGWGELPASLAKPRGGTTRGAPVTLAPGRALPSPEIAAGPDAFARDRAGILALAGDYKVSFHFMESRGPPAG
jgi:hypothetical protein